jgi:hypothetical protein
MIVEFRPSLGFERFAERTFALDRAGYLNAKGRGSPLRVATARPHDAEFFFAARSDRAAASRPARAGPARPAAAWRAPTD